MGVAWLGGDWHCSLCLLHSPTLLAHMFSRSAHFLHSLTAAIQAGLQGPEPVSSGPHFRIVSMVAMSWCCLRSFLTEWVTPHLYYGHPSQSIWINSSQESQKSLTVICSSFWRWEIEDQRREVIWPGLQNESVGTVTSGRPGTITAISWSLCRDVSSKNRRGLLKWKSCKFEKSLFWNNYRFGGKYKGM